MSLVCPFLHDKKMLIGPVYLFLKQSFRFIYNSLSILLSTAWYMAKRGFFYISFSRLCLPDFPSIGWQPWRLTPVRGGARVPKQQQQSLREVLPRVSPRCTSGDPIGAAGIGEQTLPVLARPGVIGNSPPMMGKSSLPAIVVRSVHPPCVNLCFPCVTLHSPPSTGNVS
jgi:hypothetical protein